MRVSVLSKGLTLGVYALLSFNASAWADAYDLLKVKNPDSAALYRSLGCDKSGSSSSVCHLLTEYSTSETGAQCPDLRTAFAKTKDEFDKSCGEAGYAGGGAANCHNAVTQCSGSSDKMEQFGFGKGGEFTEDDCNAMMEKAESCIPMKAGRAAAQSDKKRGLGPSSSAPTGGSPGGSNTGGNAQRNANSGQLNNGTGNQQGGGAGGGAGGSGGAKSSSAKDRVEAAKGYREALANSRKSRMECSKTGREAETAIEKAYVEQRENVRKAEATVAEAQDAKNQGCSEHASRMYDAENARIEKLKGDVRVAIGAGRFNAGSTSGIAARRTSLTKKINYRLQKVLTDFYNQCMSGTGIGAGLANKVRSAERASALAQQKVADTERVLEKQRLDGMQNMKDCFDAADQADKDALLAYQEALKAIAEQEAAERQQQMMQAIQQMLGALTGAAGGGSGQANASGNNGNNNGGSRAMSASGASGSNGGANADALSGSRAFAAGAPRSCMATLKSRTGDKSEKDAARKMSAFRGTMRARKEVEGICTMVGKACGTGSAEEQACAKFNSTGTPAKPGSAAPRSTASTATTTGR